MPYIVTTRRVSEPHDGSPAARKLAQARATGRQCVATLEEAREAAQDAVGNATPEDRPAAGIHFMHEAESLPDSGGTIGPLPDGTVVEVEPCDRFWLLSELGRDAHSSDTVAELIDAWNAAQEVGV